MIMDETLEILDNASANTLGTGVSNVGDVLDLGAPNRDIGNGEVMYLVIQVGTAADGGGGASGTTAFQLASDATETLNTAGNQTIHFTSNVFTAAELALGRRFVFPLPYGNTGPNTRYERYLGLQIVQGAEEEDDLTIDAFVTNHPPADWISQPDAIN